LAAAIGLAATLIAVPVTAHAAATDCKTVSADLVRPDSGTAGDWATDTFHRTVKICHTASTAKAVEVQSWTYTAVGDDSGTFTTKGTKSFKGATMKPDVTGKMAGHFELTFDAPKDWGLYVGAPKDGSKYSTGDWLGHLFSDGMKAGKFVWGWNYETCNEKLTNASTGNPGDITGLSKTPCYQVAFLDKCDGTVQVSLGNQAPSSLSIAYYVIDKKTYAVAGSSAPDLVVVHPVNGYVIVTARGHLPWKHKWTPVCVSQSPTPTGGATNPTAPPSLPVTGPSMPILVGAGVLFLGAGVGLVLALRRRRIRFTA
jgi:hypothetical protein